MPEPIDELNSLDNNPPQEPQTTEPTPSASSPVVEPTIASGPDSSSPFVPDATPKKSHKKLIMAVIAGFIALLALGGGVAYALYMNNPDKILLEATQNLLKANSVITKGTFTADSKENKMSIKVAFSSQSDNAKQAGSLDAKVEFKYQDTELNLNGEGMVAESGDLYFKLNDTSKMLDTALKSEFGKSYTTQPGVAQLAEKVSVFLKKIDGQWIKVDKTDLDQFSASYSKQQTCVKKAFATFNKSEEQQKQVLDTYSENPFITIEGSGKSATINNQDSAAYEIFYNAQASKTFGNELEKTDLIKAINKCTDTKSTPSKLSKTEIQSQQKQANSIKTTLWISKQSHELQKIDIENKDKKPGNAEFSMTLDTKTKPSLKDPKKYIKFKDLMPDLMAIYFASGGSNPSFTGEPSYDARSQTNAQVAVKKAEAYAADHDGLYPTLDQLKADQDIAKLPAELSSVISSEAPDAANQSRIQYTNCNNGEGYRVYYWRGGTLSENLGYGCDS